MLGIDFLLNDVLVLAGLKSDLIGPQRIYYSNIPSENMFIM